MGVNFNISGYNESTQLLHPKINDQILKSDSKYAVQFSQSSSNSPRINPAFESPPKVTSKTRRPETNKLNVNIERKSVSDKENEQSK